MNYVSFFVGVLTLIYSVQSFACETPYGDNALNAEGTHHKISATTVPADIKVGETFKVQLFLCSKNDDPFDGEIIANAIMPAHNHGMNYKPTYEKIDDGRYDIEGFLFHMPGVWLFQFDLRSNGQNEKFEIEYLLN